MSPSCSSPPATTISSSFTNRGRVYRLKGYEILEASRAARGTNIINLLPLEVDERVQAVIHSDSLDEEGYLIMPARRGLSSAPSQTLPQHPQKRADCH